VSTSPTEPRESYRRAELRLRLLLLGDESRPGVIRSEEARLRAQAELRHMRHAVGDLAEALEEPQPAQSHAADDLLTPADAARALGVDVSSVYRAVRRGDVRAVRPAARRRGGMRIPADELRRLVEVGSSRDA
jgi:excisionase family DNA binding protein